MRIHSIEISNFRAIDHLVLDDLPDTGVVVIEGDNEQGKSSILEAILTVLTDSHKSAKQAIKALQPVDRDVPVIIRLDLTVGPTRFVITKHFLKQKSAVLHVLSPHKENYTGEQAESHLAEILESHLDRSLLDALLMRQGSVEASINAVGIPSLTSALTSRDGNAGDDSREDTALMEAVEAEYATYYSLKTGKESKKLAVYGEVVQSARTELDTARAAVSMLIAHVERVSRLELERTDAQEKLPQAREELASRRTDFTVASKVKAMAEASAQRYAQVKAEYQAATKAQQEREQLRNRAAGTETALKAAEEGIAEVTAAAEKEAAVITERELTVNQAREKETEGIKALKSARSLVAGLRDNARRIELADIIATVDELDAEILAVHMKRASHVVIKESDLEAVQHAVDEVRVLRALRQTQAGQLTVTAPTPTAILVDGTETSVDTHGSSLDLDQEIELRIGEVVLSINPGKSVSDNRMELESAEADLAELLDKCEATQGIAELRERHRTQQKLATELDTLNERKTSILRGHEIESLRAELAALGESDPEFLTDLNLEQASAKLSQAEAVRENLGEEVKQANAALDAVREQPADRDLMILRTRIEGLAANVEATRLEIADAELDASDEQLAAGVEKHKRVHDDVAAEKAEVERQLKDSDLELIERMLEGAQANVDSYASTIADATTELVRLEGHIELAAGADERMAKAEAAMDAALNRHESLLRRAHAARRLREVMIRHRDESRKRYAAPFAEKLNRLAARVFGADTDFGLDDQLSVATRSIGPRTVNLNYLSGGAQEQLAILIRFAIAELVADSSSHGGVPVFIDDALGSTDPERLRRISTLFGDAGRESQVFVLTCVPERYHFVSPKTVHHIDQLKTAGTLGV